MAKPTRTGAFLVQMIILKTNNKKRVGPRICWGVRVSAFSGGRLTVRDGANLCTARVQGPAFWFELCLLNVKPFPLSFLTPPPPPVSFWMLYRC